MPQESGRHHDIEMRPRGPIRQWSAIPSGELVLGDVSAHFLHFGDPRHDHRSIAKIWARVGQTVCLAARQPRLVLCGRDHLRIGIDAGFSIHRERVRPGPGCEVRRVNRQCLVFVFKFEIDLKVAAIHWLRGLLVTTIFFQFQIPPPFLDLV